ncbi:hypothetical protein [Streptomyces sp. Da 82-17]|uniref:hypothetical protein n=1 Tax=Streptomyces sp. Da 82-17 TaxID=3377116 RepID=UPI0038D370F1
MHRHILLVGGIAAAVLLLAAGLAFWGSRGGEAVEGGHADPPPAAAGPGLEPFREAVDALARARGVQYEEAGEEGGPYRITVTAAGTRFGTTSASASGSASDDGDGDGDGDSGGEGDSDGDGGGQGVLQIDGRTFTRTLYGQQAGPDAELGPHGEVRSGGPGPWVAVGRDEGPDVLTRTPPPRELARVLSKALAASDEGGPQLRRLHGTPVLRLGTSAGELLVTEQRPHRVLRLAGRELTPLTGKAADAMYDDLAQRTLGLGEAVDGRVTLTPSGPPRVDCTPASCTAVQPFTADPAAEPGTEPGTEPGEEPETDPDPAAKRLSAALTATFLIDGQEAGSCTSPTRTFPRTDGYSFSGALSCSAPEAGAAYAEAVRADGGRASVDRGAETVLDSRALTADELRDLVDQVEKEREGTPPAEKAE